MMRDRAPILLRLVGGLGGLVAGALIGLIVAGCLIVVMPLKSALPFALIAALLGFVLGVAFPYPVLTVLMWLY